MKSNEPSDDDLATVLESFANMVVVAPPQEIAQVEVLKKSQEMPCRYFFEPVYLIPLQPNLFHPEPFGFFGKGI